MCSLSAFCRLARVSARRKQQTTTLGPDNGRISRFWWEFGNLLSKRQLFRPFRCSSCFLSTLRCMPSQPLHLKRDKSNFHRVEAKHENVHGWGNTFWNLWCKKLVEVTLREIAIDKWNLMRWLESDFRNTAEKLFHAIVVVFCFIWIVFLLKLELVHAESFEVIQRSSLAYLRFYSVFQRYLQNKIASTFSICLLYTLNKWWSLLKLFVF